MSMLSDVMRMAASAQQANMPRGGGAEKEDPDTIAHRKLMELAVKEGLEV